MRPAVIRSNGTLFSNLFGALKFAPRQAELNRPPTQTRTRKSLFTIALP